MEFDDHQKVVRLNRRIYVETESEHNQEQQADSGLFDYMMYLVAIKNAVDKTVKNHRLEIKRRRAGNHKLQRLQNNSQKNIVTDYR